ncbi:MAG: hypothetical protein M0Z59_02110 [Nitrospiraceae bacterium]|nr:hypothetical protein [Nitrospiraceae bacterium]
MENVKTDELGPLKITYLHSQKADLNAVIVVDNTALGPSIGGVRVSPSVSALEVARLARTMTLKNSIAGLPHGGGKAGIIAGPRRADKEHMFRVFAKLIRGLDEYIPGPDMGSDEQCMEWVHEETGRATGLPAEIGGLPLDKYGATGFGLSECAQVACPYVEVELEGAKVALHGFGNVGRAAASFLAKKGAVLVAASDSQGAVFNGEGLDLEELLEIKKGTGSVINYGDATRMGAEDVLTVPCDILIPAATPDVISMDNVHSIKARLILQGANIPATNEAEQELARMGILCIPDFIANAGGVIMAAMEYARKTAEDAFKAISDRIRQNTYLIIGKSRSENKLPRTAAEEIAKERVFEAMKARDY